MSDIRISGYGDDLTINGVRIGDLGPAEHEAIELEKGGQNYAPLENVVVSHVQDSSTLICRKPDPEGIKAYVEEELLDGLCCYSAVNQGQLNKTIVDAVIAHLRDEKIPTVPRSIRHKYMAAFLMAATAVTKMEKVVPKVAGVEAPELMAKLSRRWGYRVKGIPANEAIIVVAAENFHGRSLFAVSASTDPMAKDDFGPFLPGIEVVPFNDADALEALFKEKGHRIASYIVEPIQGEAGVILPTADYLPRVAELCKQYNVLFCVDEVQTGFARTGAHFAHMLYDVHPDLMACGKAAGGGIMPVSFVAGRRDVIDVLTPGSEGSTFGGFPLASVTAVFSIKAMIDEKLAENAKNMGDRLLAHFESVRAEFPDKIKEGRGAGLLTAFEMFDKPGLDGHKVSLKLLENGIYAKETHKTTVRLAPALTITAAGIDYIGDSIRKVIREL